MSAYVIPRCPVCAAKADPGDRFCAACGSRLDAPPPVTAPLPSARPIRTTTAYAPQRAKAMVSTPSLGAVLIAIAGSIAVIVGSIGPWALVSSPLFGQFRVDGLSGDGRATVWAGVAAGVLMVAVYLKPKRLGFAVLAAVILLLIAGIGFYDWMNLRDVANDEDGLRYIAVVRVGWGLMLVTIGATIGAIGAIVQTLNAATE